METKPESHSIESLSLFSGEIMESKILILVTGKRMAISTDSGPDDAWRNKEPNIGFPYVYEPLNLSKITDLEKVW